MDEYSSGYPQNRSFSAPAPLLEAPGYGYGWQPEPEPKNTNALLDYIHFLNRKRKLILLLALAGALAGLLVNIAVLPLYRARTSLDIQNLNSDLLDMKAASAASDPAGAANEVYMQTQIKMLQSDTLLEDTVRALETQPHAPYVERDDLLSRIRNRLHLGHSAPIPYSMLLRDAAARTKVEPLGLTRLVEITCDSWNADFSARFCNTLTETFGNDDYAALGAEAAKASDWLTRQAENVRAQAEESEKRLEAATGGNGLLLSSRNGSVAEDRLRQLQEELVRAQADRMEKQAALETGRNKPADALPGVIDTPRSRQAQQQRLQDDYNAARHREDLLRITYDAQEAHTSSELGKTNRVNLLRREVDSEQQLYQTLLQRAKEAGFALATHVHTVRIVDVAKPPKVAFWPERGSEAWVGLLLGSLAGVSFAFYKERTAGILRIPGQVQSRIHVQELGVIPSMGKPRGSLDAVSPSLLRSLPGTRHTRPSPGSSLSSQAPSLGAPHIWSEPFSIAAEAYRNTTLSILLASRMLGPAKMYVVSSPNAGEGKTTVVSNLGVALSQSQRRVVILDGDLRKPGQHLAFGLGNTTGVRNLLRGEINPLTAPLDLFCQKTSFANLSIVTSGSGSEEVTELLHSPRAADLLQRLGEEFDLVLIDTPPMLHMADARIFADHTDGVILVFRSGVTNLDQAQAAHQILMHDRVRVLGTILNDFDPAREGMSGYYKSYYQYKDAVEANGAHV